MKANPWRGKRSGFPSACIPLGNPATSLLACELEILVAGTRKGHQCTQRGRPGHCPEDVISVMQPSSQAPPASGLTLAYVANSSPTREAQKGLLSLEVFWLSCSETVDLAADCPGAKS